MRFTSVAAPAALVLATLTGCGEQDVLVATAVATPDGGPHFDGGPGQACTTNASCLEEEYCAKPSCSAKVGQCKVRPLQCDNSTQSVCGCDGIYYWNDCLRQADGIASSTNGPCGENAAPCGGPDHTTCSQSNALCNKIAPGAPDPCTSPSVGFCWVLPQSCPSDAGPPTWRSCGPGPSRCVDTCTAILSGEPYTSAPPMCPP